MTSPDSVAPRRPALGVALLALAVLLAGWARFWPLEADPSPRMPDAAVMDEGLWADSARGAVLFEDRFADDLGNAWLVAPLYTVMLEGVYRTFGIGLWQTRLPAALASVLMALLLGAWLGRRLGWGWGALAALMVTLAPLLDQHGRFALLEGPQAFCILAAFVCLFAARPHPLKAALAGVLMGAAMAIKPNSAQFGVLPLGIAFLWQWRHAVRTGVAAAHRTYARLLLGAVLGGLLALAAMILPVWLRHWAEWRATMQAEGGIDGWDLWDHLLRSGLIGSRESRPGEHKLWAPLRFAPAAFALTWLWCLERTRRGRAELPAWERALAVWLTVSVLVGELSYQHVARRQVLMIAPMIGLGVALLARLRATPTTDPADTPRPFRARPPFVAWLLLLAPVLLAIKPWVCAQIAPHLVAHVDPTVPGRAGHVAGLWFLGNAALLALVLKVLPWDPRALTPGLLRLAPVAAAALLLFEAASLGALRPSERTIRMAQDRLTPLVQPGEVVLGQNAALLLQQAPVRTVRRVLPGAEHSQPRPNPDVWERLQPRYLLDYADPELRQLGDLLPHGYVPIQRVGFLRESDGSFRFEVELWERR